MKTCKNLVILGLVAGLSAPAVADPCGMVPPIRIADTDVPAIQRTGPQRTYVMFHEGVQTMALRPGFTGKVDDFGMLIPFPSPPALRKIEDATFRHIEGAVDPPEIDVWLYDPYEMYEEEMNDGGIMPAPTEAAVQDGPLRYDEVRVLNQEAVGMYQVAVLEAGSPKALASWMTENGYRYPDGMDAVVQDYVGAKWCFVAIKATVGQAPGVAPRPGMREAESSLPDGASFDGHVQGMGFRFRASAPVIPMRLSVFNPDASGDGPRNVVYALTEGGIKLADVGEQTVVRQIAGSELYDRLTGPLDVVWHNGTAQDVDQQYRRQVALARDPSPYNGVAKALFAADLHAATSKTLSLPFEEEEKELLRISEYLGLRGAEVDAQHAVVIAEQRDWLTRKALDELPSLTLTVIDGSLPVEVLARQNLSFEAYTMPQGSEPPRHDPLQASNLSLSFPTKISQ